jgi:hypothetical protein
MVAVIFMGTLHVPVFLD